jgi:hypothetical protein
MFSENQLMHFLFSICTQIYIAIHDYQREGIPNEIIEWDTNSDESWIYIMKRGIFLYGRMEDWSASQSKKFNWLKTRSFERMDSFTFARFKFEQKC